MPNLSRDCARTRPGFPNFDNFQGNYQRDPPGEDLLGWHVKGPCPQINTSKDNNERDDGDDDHHHDNHDNHDDD